METGNKLVILNGLKAVYDKVNADVTELKAATGDLIVSYSGADLWWQGAPGSTGSTSRVTTYSTVNDVYTITPTGSYAFALRATGMGYLKSDGTFTSEIQSARNMSAETEIQPLISSFSGNNYAWYAVAWLPTGGTISPSDVSGFVIKRFKTKQLDEEIAEQGSLWGVQKSANLFDKSNITLGKYITVSNSQVSYVDDSNMFYALVPIPSSGTYTFLVSRKFFGNSANKIRIFNDSDAYVGTVNATLDSTDSSDTVVAHLTVTDQYYNAGYHKIGITNAIYTANLMIVVSGNTYPENYIPFVDGPTVPTLQNPTLTESSRNTLYRKKVVFDGDSICNAASEGIPRLGWAGRIGMDADMEWYNEGVSGATVTPNLGASKSILSTYISKIRDAYTDLDYYIFDGGTNDADRQATLGEFYPNVFNPEDPTHPFDTTTFSGAFESLIYNILTDYPHIKLGYIVAQKMRKAPSQENPNPDTTLEAYQRRWAFFERAIAICQKWGVPYIDLWNGSTLNPFLVADYDITKTSSENAEAGKKYADGQHLTKYGYEAISPKIEAWMKTL